MSRREDSRIARRAGIIRFDFAYIENRTGADGNGPGGPPADESSIATGTTAINSHQLHSSVVGQQSRTPADPGTLRRPCRQDAGVTANCEGQALGEGQAPPTGAFPPPREPLEYGRPKRHQAAHLSLLPGSVAPGIDRHVAGLPCSGDIRPALCPSNIRREGPAAAARLPRAGVERE